MDFAAPVQALIPGAQGRILAVLAEDDGRVEPDHRRKSCEPTGGLPPPALPSTPPSTPWTPSPAPASDSGPPAKRTTRSSTFSAKRDRPDGADVHSELSRLLPPKTKAEYDPDDIAEALAGRAVERARRGVTVARRLVVPLP